MSKDEPTPKKISGAFQDKYLLTFFPSETGCNPGLNVIKVGGRQLLLVNCLRQWLCYDIQAGIWSIWSSTKISFGPWRNRLSGEGLLSAYGNNYYSWNTGTTVPYLDVDANITRNIIVGPIDFNTGNNKRWNGVHILGDQQTTTSNLSISTSFDDFANFSTARTVDMSGASPFTKGLGTGRRIIFKLTDTVQREQRLSALDLDVDILDS